MFEVVWIDPLVVASDLNMTLIRSDRIDSIQPPPGEIITSAAPAISFDINEQPCVTVKMLDARGKCFSCCCSKRSILGITN